MSFCLIKKFNKSTRPCRRGPQHVIGEEAGFRRDKAGSKGRKAGSSVVRRDPRERRRDPGGKNGIRGAEARFRVGRIKE